MTEPIEVEATPTEQAVAIVKPQEQAVVNPLDLEPAMFKAGLDRRKENRKALIDWVREALVEGTDFGRIPTKRGPSKPSLWKPGAEKICGMLGVTPTFPTMSDYEQNALKGVQIKSIVLRCDIVNSGGSIIAHGIGCRDLDQDYGDLNKAMKMAAKSAHIDATLRMAGLSEIFTQDIEDMPRGTVQGGPASAPSVLARAPSSPAKAPEPPEPTQITPHKLKPATDETRKWFCEKMAPSREQATQFLIDLGWLMPNEPMDQLPLRFVANTKPKLVAFMAKMLVWTGTGKVEKPYEPDWDAEPNAKRGTNVPQENPKSPGTAKTPTVVPTKNGSGGSATTEPWYNAIVPVPHKGEKRNEYLKHPDTIGSLYELRHDDDDARKRLWGFVANYEPKPWVGNDGKERPPSKTDIQFREALDQFADWFEKNHPEEKL